ncbi:hypothetical protein [Archaeoglobus veneficus]|uniref:Uncharacterized protein n=1 Tax=Archaeoglobus veneficus (strain DSM 11195 / SNP6) TaxID=693661 RepID=F2KRQ6_ARCVS|nr:hypothetical protein [Archaeoglobus veneficus]AEA47920.1 hypothetical protein Arcve_1927 [Archaeoglobus veneficus SNP6]
MYGFARVEDERVVKVLALMGLLAMVGMAVMPVVVGDVGAALAGAYAGYTAPDQISAILGGATSGWFVGVAAAGLFWAGVPFAVALALGL